MDHAERRDPLAVYGKPGKSWKFQFFKIQPGKSWKKIQF
jgi:hypothetical protein